MSDNSNSSDEFEVLFAEITKDEQTVGTAAVTEQTTEAQLVSKPEPEATELPDIKQDPKPARYSEIPSDLKQPVDGSPFDATVYPAGYVKCKWPARYGNQCFLYLDQFEELQAWMKSDEADQWLEKAKAAGLRKRGEPKAEG